MFLTMLGLPLDELPRLLEMKDGIIRPHLKLGTTVRAHRLLHDRLAPAGATGYEYRVLAALAGSAPTSQAEIGRAVALDPRDVTHTVRALESRGLLARQPHPRTAG